MKNTLKLLALLCFVLLSGCSSPKKQLIGKWRLQTSTEDSGTKWEFFKSGDFSHYSAPSDSTETGKYEWIDKSHIRLSTESSAAQIAEVKIDGETLTLSTPEASLDYDRLPD